MNSPELFRSMREQIADHIRMEVFTGRLRPGERLREQHLAHRYGVSRGPVRDALLQLTQEGVLVARPYSGVSVRHPPQAELQPLIVGLRRQIELFALERLCARPDKERLARMERHVQLLKDACERGDVEAVVGSDMAFHRLLVRVAGEEAVALWLPVVARMFLRYSRLEDWMQTFHEHAAILDAVHCGQQGEAAAALQQNIQ